MVWDKAVDWIAHHESRVRVEEGRIAGEDFTVWRWIQSDPPPTEEPPKNDRDRFWQGKAFEDYPPGMDSRMAPPAGQPSPCIRLKNMFDPVRCAGRVKAFVVMITHFTTATWKKNKLRK